MAGSVNKVILIGRLGRDPEIRYTQGGDPIASLNIATSDTWRDKETGERRERTEWHRVVVFGQTAKVVEQYLRKGRQVYIEGKLQTSKWQDQNGQDRYTTEVVANNFGGLTMLGGRTDDDTLIGENKDSFGANAPVPDEDNSRLTDPLDDDIPF